MLATTRGKNFPLFSLRRSAIYLRTICSALSPSCFLLYLPTVRDFIFRVFCLSRFYNGLVKKLAMFLAASFFVALVSMKKFALLILPPAAEATDIHVFRANEKHIYCERGCMYFCIPVSCSFSVYFLCKSLNLESFSTHITFYNTHLC